MRRLKYEEVEEQGEEGQEGEVRSIATTVIRRVMLQEISLYQEDLHAPSAGSTHMQWDIIQRWFPGGKSAIAKGEKI